MHLPNLEHFQANPIGKSRYRLIFDDFRRELQRNRREADASDIGKFHGIAMSLSHGDK
jgi:hypothetical protein